MVDNIDFETAAIDLTGGTPSVNLPAAGALANDVIIFHIVTYDTTAYVTVSKITIGTTGLTPARRGGAQYVYAAEDYANMEEWWVTNPSAIAGSTTVQVTLSGTPSNNTDIDIFGVMGCPTPANPFDPQNSAPVTTTSSGLKTISVNLTTAKPDDFVFGLFAYIVGTFSGGTIGGLAANTISTSNGSGGSENTMDYASFYLIEPSQLSAAAVQAAIGSASDILILLADAIVGPFSPSLPIRVNRPPQRPR